MCADVVHVPGCIACSVSQHATSMLLHASRREPASASHHPRYIIHELLYSVAHPFIKICVKSSCNAPFKDQGQVDKAASGGRENDLC